MTTSSPSSPSSPSFAPDNSNSHSHDSCHSNWTDRTAICWEKNIKNKNDNNNCYWSKEIIDLFRPFIAADDEDNDNCYNDEGKNQKNQENDDDDEDDENQVGTTTKKNDSNKDENDNGNKDDDDNDNKDDDDNKENRTIISKVSYETLFLLAAGVIQQIQYEYNNINNNNDNDDDNNDNNIDMDIDNDTDNDADDNDTHQYLTIAIAIPEGPMLPLAVVVVHALNYIGLTLTTNLKTTKSKSKSKSNNSSNSSNNNGRDYVYVVLVLLDPEEGMERLQHILNETTPTFILTIPGNKDCDKLQALIDNNNQQSSSSNNTNKNTNTNTRLLDLVQLVTTARKKLLSLTTSSLTSTTLTTTTLEDLSLVSDEQHLSLSSSLNLKLNLNLNQNGKRTTTRNDNSTQQKKSLSYRKLVMDAVAAATATATNSSSSSSSIQQRILSQLTTQLTVISDNKNKEKKENQLSSSTTSSPSPQQPLVLTLPSTTTTKNNNFNNNTKISHIVYTSGSSGYPKGCLSSTKSLLNYIHAKNIAHNITPTTATTSTILLASSLTFDPCFSDILATFETFNNGNASATLAIVSRSTLMSNLTNTLQQLQITHVLCTPTLWSLVSPLPSMISIKKEFPYLQRIVLGGEPIPKSIIQIWARKRRRPKFDKEDDDNEDDGSNGCRLLATYGVTEACVYQTCGEVFQFQNNDDNNNDGNGNRNRNRDRNSGNSGGQYVGSPFQGTKIRICQEDRQDILIDVNETNGNGNMNIGEIILYGNQVDKHTGYLHRIDLNKQKFVTEEVIEENEEDDGMTAVARKKKVYYYRTGDFGYINPYDGSLTILGRIIGEEGMIKINGIRIELEEIEATIIGNNNDDDDYYCPVVLDCLTRVIKIEESNQQYIHAYCVLSDTVWKELGLGLNNKQLPQQLLSSNTSAGIIINGGPLWILLRITCSRRLKNACIPTIFIGIRQLPLSRTGKRNRNGLPDLKSCDILNNNSNNIMLKDYGLNGDIVSKTLIQYLNLQRCQQHMLTTSISFAMLGGDSLSAAIICRTLYAHLQEIPNSRWIGGGYGQLPEPFNTTSLLRVRNLGDYVDLLDHSTTASSSSSLLLTTSTTTTTTTTNNSNDDPSSLSSSTKSSTDTAVVLTAEDDDDNDGGDHNDNDNDNDNTEQALLYDALLQATTLGQSTIAAAILLNLSADPNYGIHNGRIGKTTKKIEQRAIFKSTPLHLACFKGDAGLVKLLLRHNANYRSPNTNGLFPIHLAAGGLDGIEGTAAEDQRRLECVKSLLNAGCPLLMKDANKQTILHSAARAGHIAIIDYVINECLSSYIGGGGGGGGNGNNNQTSYRGAVDGPPPPSHFINFYDRWFRSAVHWATLNGRVRALKLLLDHGCNPAPGKRKTNKYTSLVTETPLEICQRLYGGTDKGNEMEEMLMAAILGYSNEKSSFKVKNLNLEINNNMN